MKQLAGEGAERASLKGARLFMLTLTAPGEGTDLEEWNRTLPQRWSWFVTEVRRRLPATVVLEFVKTFEYQRRGALHIHALCAVHGVVSIRSLRSAMFGARQLWDFGPQWRLDAATAEAAWYIAKYVSKHASEMPRGCGHRVWSCSRSWGSMKAIRERQRVWACAGGCSARQSGAPPVSPTGGAAGADLDPKTGTYAQMLATVPHGVVVEGIIAV